MDGSGSGSGSGPVKELPLGLDATTEEDYSSMSKILQEFCNISNIDKAWIIKSDNGNASQAMFSLSQPNVLANKMRKFILSARVISESDNGISFQWSPFPIEMTGVSIIVPSPSGSKLLVVRNPENESPSQFEIWDQYKLQKEFQIPESIHGSVYTDEWFEGISWNSDETRIAYVAEEPFPSKPTFNSLGYKKGGSTERDYGSWKGQGDWEEDWGETYEGKRRPVLFVININSGEVRTVEGIRKSLSVGQVVWAPSTNGFSQYLVFVGWPANTRKLGMKYCNNRPCALYAIRDPFQESKVDEHMLKDNGIEDSSTLNLTPSISSAFYPRFSPDGNFLVFLSAASAVDSGEHWGTNSLHRIDWPADGKPNPSAQIIEVVPVVMCGEDGCFPGLYCESNFLTNPWLSDGRTMIIPSTWRSTEVILAVDALSGNVSCVIPTESNYSWNILTLDGDNIVAVSSSPVCIPEIKYGCFAKKATSSAAWNWLDVSSPIRCSEKVTSLLSSLQFNVMKIPVKNVNDSLTKGAKKPFEAIIVSSNSEERASNPLIVILHGGPHSVSVSTFSKSLAFLSSIGFSLLIVNYRGSLGFGEEALQSLPGKVGSQDVEDVLTAIDHVIDLGLSDPSKIFVFGGSHGGFLTTHLIGQAPDKFAAAAAKNPVCNHASMVGVTDIPDWCFYNAYGNKWKDYYTGAPSADDLSIFHSISPISHLSKVKTPTIFLLGSKDLRVPVSNGLEYARALKEKGVEVKIIVFPEDVHTIKRPQSNFESFLNIGVWFGKYCK